MWCFFSRAKKKHFKKPLEMKGYWNCPYQPASLKQPWRFTLFQRPALLWPHQHLPPWNANFNTHKAQNCEWYHKIIFIVRSNLINPNVLFWKPFYMQTLLSVLYSESHIMSLLLCFVLKAILHVDGGCLCSAEGLKVIHGVLHLRVRSFKMSSFS